MQVIIHVGPAKTGSTALQQCLLANRELLQTEGFYYPEHSRGNSTGHDGLVLSEGRDGQLIVDHQKCDELLQWARAADSNTLLLSSENFQIDMPALAEVFGDARFVYYFRHPLMVLESSYNQWVKRHGETHKLNDYGEVLTQCIDFLDSLELSLKRLGTGSLCFRYWGPGLFAGGSIIRDFLDAIGLGHLDLLADSGRVNSSYSLEALEFKRLCNQFPVGKLNFRLDRALQSFSKGTKHYSLISPEVYHDLKHTVLQQYSDFNARWQIPGFDRFLCSIAETAQPEFRPQVIDKFWIDEINGYIKYSDRQAWKRLRKLVADNSGKELDNPDFIKAVGGLRTWISRLKLSAAGRSRDKTSET